MIGNYLKTDNSTPHFIDVVKVESIQHDGINITDSDGNSYATEFEWDFLDSIPLTEKWLFRFGYINLNNKYFTIQGHLIWICNDLFMCDKNGIVLKYVHQLQNLYFALNSKELILNN